MNISVGIHIFETIIGVLLKVKSRFFKKVLFKKVFINFHVFFTFPIELSILFNNNDRFLKIVAHVNELLNNRLDRWHVDNFILSIFFNFSIYSTLKMSDLVIKNIPFEFLSSNLDE